MWSLKSMEYNVPNKLFDPKGQYVKLTVPYFHKKITKETKNFCKYCNNT